MKHGRSRALCLTLLFTSLSLLAYHHFLDQRLYYQQYPSSPPQRNLKILLWHWPFGRSYSLRGNKCLQMYNISHCFLTANRSSFSAADVVVFHHYELSTGASSLPLHLKRPASQRWAWLSMEPPINNANLQKLNGLFNLTMSYRRDADVPIPYGKTVQGADMRRVLTASNHSCLVSWVVSKYKPHQSRTDFYESLRKHVPIKVYGRWNGNPLPHLKLLPTIGNCLFYLSFENSVAKDYISEKLWRNAFQAGVVPVVLGPSRSSYEAVAPPHSFIHVSDFKSTAHLASYLMHLAEDKAAYQEYFQWRHTHRIQTYTDWRERLCQICLKFASFPSRKIYHDLEAWVHS